MADVAEEYRSSLSELNFNSKPRINMLTMLAEENVAHASVIVQAIVDHINSVTPDIKLPSLYLVDSIVKNIGKAYISLFSKHLVSLFTSVCEKLLRNDGAEYFEGVKNCHRWTKKVLLPGNKVGENTRSLLYKLRSTWTGIFPNTVLLSLDRNVILLDPAWPILAQPPDSIHVNPKFLDKPSPPVQKKASSRDPRLSKKVPPVSPDSESTVLQSVAVIPKGNGTKRNEKESIAPAAKKVKLDDSITDSPKKEPKIKPSSGSTESESNAKLNTVKLLHTISSGDTKHNRGKKRSLSSQHVNENPAKLSRGDKWSATNSEQKPKHGNSKINYLPGKSDDLPNIKSHNHFPHNATDIEENKNPYKMQPVGPKKEEIFSKGIQKMGPPPLFLGNEDKDYRILPKNVEDRNTKESTLSKRRYFVRNERKFHQYKQNGNALPIVKSFLLDKKERKIYFVNDRSFAFMDDNTPRELTFDGPSKFVLIEGMPQPIELRFGEEVKFIVDGKSNFIKFGTPSREVYINDYPYEAQFGGPPFTATLSNDKTYTVHISGPAPQVILSERPATELYEKFCQSNQEFLRKFDSEPNISGAPIGTQDVDMRVKNVKFPSMFFSFPLEKMHDVDWQRVHVGNSQQTEWSVPKNSFETFKDAQPQFVTPGGHHEEPSWMKSVPLPERLNAPLNPPPLPPKQIINRFPCMPPPCTSSFGPTFTEVKRPLLPTPRNVPYSHSSHTSIEFASIRPELNSMNNSVIPRLSPPPLPPFMGPIPNTSCMTSTHLVTTAAPYNNTNTSAPLPLLRPSGPLLNLPPLQSATRLAAPLPVSNFAAANQMPQYSVPENVPNFIPAPVSTPAPSAKITNDMQFLMEKLKAAGLIKSETTTSSTVPVSNEAEEKEEELPKEETIPEITFDSKCLKEFHSGVIAAIYSGSQCAICGMRFKEMQSKQYSRHLDWHFRRNRRGKDGAKKPFSRRWFYEIKDWIQFKEFEDVDERAPSYFELQANVDQTEETPENTVSVSCSEIDSENCAVCGEQFQLFWNEEEEEWHLRNAIKQDDQVYHPACYEDYKKFTECNSAEISFDDSDIKPDEDEYDSDIKAELMDITKTEKEVDKEKIITELKIKEEPKDLDIDDKPDKKEDQHRNEKKLNDQVKGKADKKHLNSQKDDTKLDKKESSLLKEVVCDDPIISAYKNDKVEENVKFNLLSTEPIKKEPIEAASTMCIVKKESLESNEINSKTASVETAVKKKPVESEKMKGQTASTETTSIEKPVDNEKREPQTASAIAVVKKKPAESEKMEVQKASAKTVIKKGRVESEKIDIQTASAKTAIKKKPADNDKMEVQTISTKSGVKKNPAESVKVEVQTASAETAIKKKPAECIKMEVPAASAETAIMKKPAENERMEVQAASAESVIKRKPVKNEKMGVQSASIEPVIEMKPMENDLTAITEKISEKELIKEDEKSQAEVKNDKKGDSSKSETESVVKSSDTPVDVKKTNKQSELSGPLENVPNKPEDELEDIEFCPPTPDPRFEVLPPVFRGTEISNLCVIM